MRAEREIDQMLGRETGGLCIGAWSTRVGYRALQIKRDLADVQMRGPIAGVVDRF